MSTQIASSKTPIKALVTIRKADKPQRGIKEVSCIVIAAGPLSIGSVTVSGRYTEEQAVAYFKQNKNRFKAGKDHETAKTLGII